MSGYGNHNEAYIEIIYLYIGNAIYKIAIPNPKSLTHLSEISNSHLQCDDPSDEIYKAKF